MAKEKMIKPNFIIIGAAKAGTTSLYNYLNQHPQVFMSENKEPHFFSLEGESNSYQGPGDKRGFKYRIKDWDTYLGLFDGAVIGQAIGEASTHYLYQLQAAKRMRDRLPDVKLIAILRNPVEAAYSAYLHMCREGREPFSDFEEALKHEWFRIENNWAPLWHYSQQWHYAKQIKHWQEYFPKEQMRFFLYEDLKERPEWLVREVSAFLGIGKDFKPDFSIRHNQSGKPRSQMLHYFLTRSSRVTKIVKYLLPQRTRKNLKAKLVSGNLKKSGLPAMTEEVRLMLEATFKQDKVELEKLINRDLSGWEVKQ